MSFISYMIACAREYSKRKKHTSRQPSDEMNLMMHEKGYELAKLKNGNADTGVYIENGVETVVVRYSHITDGRHDWSGDALIRWYHRTNVYEGDAVVFVFDPDEDR